MNQDEFECERKLKRAVNLLAHEMNMAKKIGKLSGDAALRLYNNFGLDTKTLIYIAASHEVEFNTLEFLHLVNEQEKQRKDYVQCSKMDVKNGA